MSLCRFVYIYKHGIILGSYQYSNFNVLSQLVLLPPAGMSELYSLVSLPRTGSD